jgi:hypothetical protein
MSTIFDSLSDRHPFRASPTSRARKVNEVGPEPRTRLIDLLDLELTGAR